MELFGKALEVFDRIKNEGEREGNIGKRTFGKILHNSSYGVAAQNWLSYGLTSHNKSNLTIGIFIVSYARMVSVNIVGKIFKMKGKVFYMDTDSFDTNVKLPEHMVGSKMGQLKYEGSFDKSIYLGRKQYYLMNTMSGVSKTGCKRIRNSLADTELDIPTVRVGGYRNSKIPTLKAWTRGALEKRAIKEILSNPQTLNYSIRTGELLDKGLHLIVLDIDFKKVPITNN
uniref:Truncated plasmid-related DNA polymerase n=1 Tax=Glomus sp. DAOM 240422 TaxID=1281822 RepID=S4UJM4_9GLOM|nr:truncated plasmid-related DNA polymerase [Glomus sp. DAOM 240422]